MATQTEVRQDPNYICVHDHGFVGYVDHMGSDAAIVQAARVSYGAGTKTVLEDRALLRYLVRHKHTSPLEMCEIKLHIKLPIFIMRQLVRHRTASLNEYSGRYSEMTDEMYVPDLDYIKPQSKTNKQGSDGEIAAPQRHKVRRLLDRAYKASYLMYRTLMQPGAQEQRMVDEFNDTYPGMSRELSRIVLPVATYTECYWKIDLHNLFHFLRLRLDSHAQQEIRDYSEAIYNLARRHFPIACEAFEDYIRESKTLSRMEVNVIRSILIDLDKDWYEGVVPTLTKYLDREKVSKREKEEFLSFWLKN